MRKKSELRDSDVKQSDIVTEFLEDVFFNTVTEKYEIVEDKERQIKGIDVIFDFNNETYICDIKSAVQYINKNLKTFSFELEFINRFGSLNEGWLLSDDNVNNSYLLVWVDKATNDKISDKSELKCVEVVLVKKASILSYLEDIGWNKDFLTRKTKRIRSNKSEQMGNVYKNGCKFYFSRTLVEKPINVLLTRETLRSISDFNKVYET